MSTEIPSVVSGPAASTGMGLAEAAGQYDDDLAPAGHAGPWQPTTVRDVEWCLERIGEAETDISEVQAQLDAAVKALTARAMALTDKANRRAFWFRGLVEAWAVTNRDQVVRGKAKSRELLGGAIGFRAKAEQVVVLDEAAVLAWAEPDHADCVRVKTEVNKSALAKYVKTTGVIPPGVDVKPASESLTITVTPLPTIQGSQKGVLP